MKRDFEYSDGWGWSKARVICGISETDKTLKLEQLLGGYKPEDVFILSGRDPRILKNHFLLDGLESKKVLRVDDISRYRVLEYFVYPVTGKYVVGRKYKDSVTTVPERVILTLHSSITKDDLLAMDPSILRRMEIIQV